MARNRVLTLGAAAKGSAGKARPRRARRLPCLSPSRVPGEEGKEAGRERWHTRGAGRNRSEPPLRPTDVSGCFSGRKRRATQGLPGCLGSAPWPGIRCRTARTSRRTTRCRAGRGSRARRRQRADKNAFLPTASEAPSPAPQAPTLPAHSEQTAPARWSRQGRELLQAQGGKGNIGGLRLLRAGRGAAKGSSHLPEPFAAPQQRRAC